MSTAPKGPTPGYLVWRLSTKWRVAVDRALAPLGLTHAQYTLIASLHGVWRSGYHPSQRQLADHTGLEPLYVSKLARALESSGLVRRTPDPADTRAVQLSLTPEGEEKARRAVAEVRTLLDRLLAPLGGLDAPRTEELTRELRLLLETPLDAPPDAFEDTSTTPEE
ncbi:MarR family winged helix-turn-helix transcriptional regulator [Streptomyces pristinaespiralis]|uniref:MarR-family transcriptional regulator n=2 Tax=Streptomyces pristinaespiralis TaxID=38300 RepID=B5H6Y4_STRE2|nr:MarR family transcriptional regulator [Streptomyces pristinaespiralis]ALC23332.1 MarR family transcriptional regulator [Streptomyces pristinaespiralis]EDY62595.1 MarR-family transcriptional regulator [Streptomyces pristinaespiralis ATCC 25486]QMU14183.1 MarR family transcriptional regulator [Streptomyces pristinaespiralis]